MSKVHCDVCNVDLNKSGFAHHKKTKKHLIEDAKKYGKYDFATGQIIQTGGTIENKPVEAKQKKDVIGSLEEISIGFDLMPKMNHIKLDPSLSKHDRNLVIKQRIIDMFEGQKIPAPFMSIINGINRIEHLDENV